MTTPLAQRPAMDSLKIGPGGETFGQLKQAVRDARLVYLTHPGPTALADLDAASRMLRAAYVRVGLPYVAP